MMHIPSKRSWPQGLVVLLVLAGVARVASGCAREVPSTTTPGASVARDLDASIAEPSGTPSPLDGPCWVSMMRTLDGAPSSSQACAAGLRCDYTGSVPDGPGRCRTP